MDNTKEIILETLTPIILDEDQKAKLNYASYESILDDVMASEVFCNIALTGPYGAGKSTVMNTYEEEHKEQLKTIHISLAKFNDGNIDNMQAKLINQIIHQIDPKQIPQTQFKIKSIVDYRKVLGFSAVLFVFLISMIYLFIVPQTQMLEDSNISLFNMFWRYELNIGMLVLAMVSSAILLVATVNAQFKKPFIKTIHVDKSQIDLVGKESNEDVSNEKFDKYMDEIIYLFQQSKVDTLVIEDLDRFNEAKIFYELRQVNFLLNKKCADKKTKDGTTKKIKFIYLIRDELFEEGEDRTKFFDIIIPIVPVMDNSNSYELLKKMMGEEWLEKLNTTYLKTICLYIHDYRILKNIFNEFQIYYTQLRVEERLYSPMKLFAMITYKNLWPTDFAELQQGKGAVYQALKTTENLRQIKIARLQKEILAFEQEKKAMKKELAQNMDELDAIYFEDCLYSATECNGYYIIDGTNEYDFTNRRAFIHALKNSNSVTWKRASYSSLVPITHERIEQYFAELEKNEEYAVRKHRLKEKLAVGVTGIEAEIAERQIEIKEMEKASFKNLVVEEMPKCIMDLFPPDKLLIQIFLQDEMIANDYSVYMTYFYPYSITDKELRYLNKVFARVNDDEQAEIEISHPKEVLEYIKENDWLSVALPNKDLFKYILKQGGENLTHGIRNLYKTSNVEFAIELAQTLLEIGEIGAWYNALFEKWPDFFDDLIKVELWSKSQVMQIALQILSYLDDCHIPDDVVNDFFAQVEPELIQKCGALEIATLEKIDYKFSELSILSEEIRKQAYEKALYRMSKENIEYIMQQYYPALDDTEEVDNYVAIMAQPDESLAKYVKKDVETYLENVYIPYYAIDTKNEAVILAFLNDEQVALSTRKALINHMTVIMQDIQKVTDEVVEELVRQKKVAFTNTNVIYIWGLNEAITPELHDYLKEQYGNGKCDLTFPFAKTYFNETNDTHPKALKLIEELLDMEDFGGAYGNLVEDVKIRYSGVVEIPWNDEQMMHIVKTHIIDMTEKNLKLMRSLDKPKLLLSWLSNKVNDYLLLMKKEELRSNAELKRLIAYGGINDSEKIGCISICSEPVPILEVYNTQVVEKIFELDVFDGNFVPVIRRYRSKRYGKAFASKLRDYLVSYINHTINIKIELPKELLSHVLRSQSVTNSNKKILLSHQVWYYELETVKNLLELAGAEIYLGVFDGHKPRVEATEANRVLIDALVKQGWVSSYKAVEDDYILYPKRKIE